MAVREDKKDPWLHYSFQELKQLESRHVRNHVVGGGEEDEEDEEDMV